MLTVTTNNEESGCAKLLGLTGAPKSEGGLICSVTSLLASPDDGGFDTCSFLSPASDATIFAFGESAEASGMVAYSGSESCGSIAFSGGGESCGSIASSSGGSFSCGGGCSYSC